MTVAYSEAALHVEVTDTGRGRTDSAAAFTEFVIEPCFPVPAKVVVARDQADTSSATVGHGLRGMRERAAAAGGTIAIGPLPARGFRVAATLPLDSQATEKASITAPGQKTEKTEKAGR